MPSDRRDRDESLPRTARLLRSEDFRRIYARGRRVRSRSFTLLLHPRPSGTTRFGMSVSKRVGNAVVRNRLKRRLRELFRREIELRRQPVDLVVHASPRAAADNLDELRHQLRGALRRARVL